MLNLLPNGMEIHAVKRVGSKWRYHVFLLVITVLCACDSSLRDAREEAMAQGNGADAAPAENPSPDDPPSNPPTTPAENPEKPSQALVGFGYNHRASTNELTLSPDSIENRIYHYSFVTDHNARVGVIDQPQGTMTVSSSDGAVTVSESESDEYSTSVEVTAGEWKLRYDRASNALYEPIAFVHFVNSPFFLDLESATRSAENGTDVWLQAQITRDPVVNEFNQVETFGETVKAQQARMTVYHTLPNNSEKSIELRDNGVDEQGDQEAGDGVFSAILKLTATGRHYFNVKTDATVDNLKIQRNIDYTDLVSAYRARLASEEVEARPDLVFEQALTSGQYGVPIKIQFLTSEIPDTVKVFAEIWATDNVGGEVRLADVINAAVSPAALGDGIYGIPLIVQPDLVPSVGRFISTDMRRLSMTDIKTGDEILIDPGKLLVTGFPD